MKKNNEVRPFDAEIKQMRKNRVILIAGIKVKRFTEECNNRGIELCTGSQVGDSVIMFEKK